MNDEKWTIKLNGAKSRLVSSGAGRDVDDLDKIASTLGVTKPVVLNGDIINIYVTKIKIWHKNAIDAIQFSYKVEANNMNYSVEGDKHGGNGGDLETIDFEPDEHILQVTGRNEGNIDQLNFLTYIPSKKQSKSYGTYGRLNTRTFNLLPLTGATYTCFFGKFGNFLTGFGMYEGKISASSCANPEHQQLQTQNIQLQKDKTTLNTQLEQTKKDKATAEQERDNLKKEHTNCATKIQTLENEKQALNSQLAKTKQEHQTLQNQINQLLGISSENTESKMDSQMEAKIQQVDLPPGGNK